MRLSEQGDTDRTLRQISVLLRLTSSIIAQLVGRPCEQKRVDRIVHQLILLSSEARDAPLHDTETGGLVYSAVGAAMQLLSAENFLSIIARLLESKGTQVSTERVAKYAKQGSDGRRISKWL